MLFDGISGNLFKDSAKLLPTGNIVGTGQSNTFTAGTQDYTAATAFLLKTAAGYAPTTAGALGLNTSNNTLNYGDGSTSHTVATTTGTLTSGDCAKYNPNGKLIAAGNGCASMAGLHLVVGSSYYFAGRRMTPITTGNWTSVNFNAGVTTRYDNTGAIMIYEPNTSSSAWRFVCATLPSAPYTIRVHILAPPAVAGNANLWSIALRNSSSGSFVNYGADGGDNTFQIQKYTNPTTVSGAAIGNVSMRYSYGYPFTLQLQDDSTYRYYYFWDGFQAYNIAPANNSGWYTRVLNNDFITPDQVCAGTKMTNGNYSAPVQLIGYDVNPSW